MMPSDHRMVGVGMFKMLSQVPDTELNNPNLSCLQATALDRTIGEIAKSVEGAAFVSFRDLGF